MYYSRGLFLHRRLRGERPLRAPVEPVLAHQLGGGQVGDAGDDVGQGVLGKVVAKVLHKVDAFPVSAELKKSWIFLLVWTFLY